MSKNAEYQKTYRERQKNNEAVPTCACGKQLRGQLSRDRGICSVCWKKTDEAKAETLDRVRRLREK